ncbi:MAG TPA: hypothetical protein VK638_17105 [Edaphobacter sp.]|nr:hypothetical protein [Edaphobacter sp.]
MRRSWTPSIVPKGDDQNVYLVVDHLGRMAGSIGKPTPRPPIWKSSSSTCLRGNTKGPVRVVAFNTLEHWSEDVSKDLAREIQTRCDIEGQDVPESIRDFVDTHAGPDRQLALRLAYP